MSQFENVTAVKKANIYFNGQVTSRTLLFQDGSRKTLGIILPGECEFNTGDREIIEILSGDLDYRLPDSEWITVKAGESFNVPAKTKFRLKVREITDYCCSFFSE